MKISLSWLREFVDIPVGVEELAHRLTMAGLAVDAVDDERRAFDGIVVGYVLERVKHPNADKLSVCQVDVGGQTKEIVCGAPNVDGGQHVVVAQVGARVGDLVMERRKIRGVVSNGMICSARELGLGDDHAGIMVLDPARAIVGQPFADYRGRTDTLLELDLTPNRGDALSHLGVARDAAAIFDVPLTRPAALVAEGKTPVADLAAVEIRDPDLCPRYLARVVRNVRVGPSPQWLQERLQRVGIRPINTIVDVTNFVLMECGHPLHAFDYDRLAGHRIVVRRAAAGEKFTTLDGKERTLRDDTLLICDAERGVAVAGVMGGQNSEITDGTVNVLIESAVFKPTNIRRTSKLLGLSTDASYRFERGTDVENAVYAVNRAAQLMHELAGGEVANGVIDCYPGKSARATVTVRPSRVNALLGVDVPRAEMLAICARLGFGVADGGDAFTVTVPPWRSDVTEEVDVVEEIARIAGYDRFVPPEPHVHMRVPLAAPHGNDDRVRTIREHLVARGFHEIMTNSLIDATVAAAYPGLHVALRNPLSADMAAMRPHALPQMLAAIGANVRKGTRDQRLFELCRTHVRRDPPGAGAGVEDRFVEEECLVIALAGSTSQSWDVKGRAYDLYDVKGEVEALVGRLALDNVRLIRYNEPDPPVFSAPAMEMQRTKRHVGAFGAVAPTLRAAVDCPVPVYAAVLALDAIAAPGRTPKYEAPPRFPRVHRDLAVVAPRDVPAGELEVLIRRAAASPLLRAVDVFDVFEGGAVGAENRSIAFALEFGADDRTLRDEEIAAVMDAVIGALTGTGRFSIRA